MMLKVLHKMWVMRSGRLSSVLRAVVEDAPDSVKLVLEPVISMVEVVEEWSG